MFAGLENPFHWLFLLLVVLSVFGPRRLPELGQSLGHGMRQFRESLAGRDEADSVSPARSGKASPDRHAGSEGPRSRRSATPRAASETTPTAAGSRGAASTSDAAGRR